METSEDLSYADMVADLDESSRPWWGALPIGRGDSTTRGALGEQDGVIWGGGEAGHIMIWSATGWGGLTLLRSLVVYARGHGYASVDIVDPKGGLRDLHVPDAGVEVQHSGRDAVSAVRSVHGSMLAGWRAKAGTAEFAALKPRLLVIDGLGELVRLAAGTPRRFIDCGEAVIELLQQGHAISHTVVLMTGSSAGFGWLCRDVEGTRVGLGPISRSAQRRGLGLYDPTEYGRPALGRAVAVSAMASTPLGVTVPQLTKEETVQRLRPVD